MRIFLTTLLLLVAALGHAQQFASELEASEVVPGIFAVTGVDAMAGGSITLLVGADYVALIDGGYGPIAPLLLEQIAEIAGRPADFIINTHWHGDHTGSNAFLTDNGTVVFAHENVRTRLAQDPTAAGGAGGLPVVTFGDDVTFHLNGIEAHAFHVAHAHTDGDTAVDFPGVNVFHAGDLLFNNIYPYIDLDSGGSVQGIIDFQQMLLERSDDETIILPGHGEIASKADLRRNLMMITDSQARVKLLIDQGRTIDDVLTANPLSVYDDEYSWTFISTEVFTRMLYRSLTEAE